MSALCPPAGLRKHLTDAFADAPMPASLRLTRFLRDAVVAALATVALLVPWLLEDVPGVVRAIGAPVYYLFFVVYNVTGGETEGPYGPTALDLAVFATVVGLLVAGLAALVRWRWGDRAVVSRRTAAAGALAALVTIAVVYSLVIALGAGPMALLALGVAIVLVAVVGVALGW